MNKVSEAKAKIIRLLQVAGPKVKNSMLALMLGLSERQVRTLVSDLVHEGYPIASDIESNKKGYFLARNDAEMCHTRNRMKVTIKTHVDRAYDLEHVDYTKTKYVEVEK